MPRQIAAFVFVLIIGALFWLDRDKRAKCSPALWIPIIWAVLASSRSVSQWTNLGHYIDANSVAQAVAEGNPIDRIVYMSLEVIGIAILFWRGKWIGRILRENLPIVSFFAFCLISLLWSDFADIAFKRWIKAIGDFVMILIVVSDRDMFNSVRRFLARAGFMLITISVLFVKYYPEYGKVYGKWDYKAVYTGVALNKNTLGCICLIFGLNSIWRLLALRNEPKGARRRRFLVAHAAMLGMVLWLFSMANSMTSFNCFLMAASLLILASTRIGVHRRALVYTAAAIITAGAASVLFLGIGGGMLNAIGRDPTLTDRTNIWALVLRLNPSRLVGAGFESFWLGPRLNEIWKQFSWQPFEAHNGYIEIYLSLGLVGITWLGAVLGFGFATVRKTYRHNPEIGNLAICLFTVGLIYNCTEAAFFRMMAPAWIMMLMSMVKVPQRRWANTARTQVTQSTDEIVMAQQDEIAFVLQPNTMKCPAHS